MLHFKDIFLSNIILSYLIIYYTYYLRLGQYLLRNTRAFWIQSVGILTYRSSVLCLMLGGDYNGLFGSEENRVLWSVSLTGAIHRLQ